MSVFKIAKMHQFSILSHKIYTISSILIKDDTPILKKKSILFIPTFCRDYCLDPPWHRIHATFKNMVWNRFPRFLSNVFEVFAIAFVISKKSGLRAQLQYRVLELQTHGLNWFLGLKNGQTLNKIYIFYFLIFLVFFNYYNFS